MKLGFIFAGQGQQFLYMGQDLAKTYPIVKNIYDQAQSILGKDVLHFNEAELAETQNTQVALFTLSYALSNILKEQGIQADMVAGLSLGEYNALCTSEVLDFKTALEIIDQRGALMQSAYAPFETGMAALLRTDRNTVSHHLQGSKVEICNVNTPSQIVIGGKKEDLDAMLVHLKKHKIRAVALKLSSVSHMSLLKNQSEALKKILEPVEFNKPSIPFINNVEAQFQQENFAETLSRQISESTELAASIQLMIDHGVTHILEIGPKNTIVKFIKEINDSIETFNAYDVPSLKESLLWIEKSQ